MPETNPEIDETHLDTPTPEDIHAELCDVLKGREQEVLKLLRYQDYMNIITPLQEELVKLQEWVKENGLKIMVIFEGRDAAGKGGTIKRFMEFLSPRICKVVALDKPTEQEQGQW